MEKNKPTNIFLQDTKLRPVLISFFHFITLTVMLCSPEFRLSYFLLGLCVGWVLFSAQYPLLHCKLLLIVSIDFNATFSEMIPPSSHQCSLLSSRHHCPSPLCSMLHLFMVCLLSMRAGLFVSSLRSVSRTQKCGPSQCPTTVMLISYVFLKAVFLTYKAICSGDIIYQFILFFYITIKIANGN